MQREPESDRHGDPDAERHGRTSGRLALGAGAFVTVLAVSGLLSWALSGTGPAGRDHLRGPVRPEEAVALALAGCALMTLVGSPGRRRRWIADTLAVLALAVTIAGTVDAVRQQTVGVLRRLLGPEAEAAGPSQPAAAVALVLLGGAVLMIDLPGPRRWRWPPALAPSAATVAAVTLLAYLFEWAGVAPGLAALTAMPTGTAVSVIVLSVGVGLARPDRGLLRQYASTGPGGELARRLIPALVAIPLGVAVLSVVLIRVGHGQSALAVALSTALFAAVLVLIVDSTVRTVDAADARRGQLLRDLAADRDFVDTLLRSLSEAVVVFDREERIVDLNPKAADLLGRSGPELVGQGPPYPWQENGWTPRQQVTGGTGGCRYVRRPDGQRVPVLARTAQVAGDGARPRAFVATFVDITDIQRAEAALADRAAELQGANEDLQRSNRELGEAATFKQDLMSLMSHELSQPLSSAASLSELLATEWSDLPDDVRLELTRKIENNVRRLTRMIHDMVLLFRLDAGLVSARRAAVPVSEVLETVVDSAPDTAQIVASVDPDLCVMVERGHLWHVLANLLSNAMTFGEPPVEITAEASAQRVRITVRDYGPGIPPERVPHLFERLQGRGTTGRRTRGSGLGLFIVRHLVEVNGGSIRYAAADPRGASLIVELERSSTSSPGTTQTTPPVSTGQERGPDAVRRVETTRLIENARRVDNARRPGAAGRVGRVPAAAGARGGSPMTGAPPPTSQGPPSPTLRPSVPPTAEDD